MNWREPSSLDQEVAAVREMINRQQFKAGEHGFGFSGTVAFNRIVERARLAVEMEQRVVELEGAFADLTSGVIA